MDALTNRYRHGEFAAEVIGEEKGGFPITSVEVRMRAMADRPIIDFQSQKTNIAGAQLRGVVLSDNEVGIMLP